MIEKGKRLPDGDNSKLRWICGPVEEVPYQSPYALITAGESLHWMSWDIVLPRFKKALTPRGYVALITRSKGINSQEEIDIINRFSTNKDFQPYDMIGELEKRGLFRTQGKKQTKPIIWRPSIDKYIEMRHSQNGLSRDRLGKENTIAFDAELRELLLRNYNDERLESEIRGSVTWGTPTP